MRMSDFVVRDSILVPLKATTKETVIREMVEGLRAAGQFKARKRKTSSAPSSSREAAR